MTSQSALESDTTRNLTRHRVAAYRQDGWLEVRCGTRTTRRSRWIAADGDPDLSELLHADDWRYISGLVSVPQTAGAAARYTDPLDLTAFGPFDDTAFPVLC